jgi:hypothetical protein
VEDFATITVRSANDTTDAEIDGYFVRLLDSEGAELDTGFTPINFTDLTVGVDYQIEATLSFDGANFTHWEDDSTDNVRDIASLSDDGITVTAFYLTQVEDNEGGGEETPTDTDADSVPDTEDNCPAVSNTSQMDADNDGIGNACDDTPFGNEDDEDQQSRRHGHSHNEAFAHLIELWVLCDMSEDAGDCQNYLTYLDVYTANHTSYSPDMGKVIQALTATGQYAPQTITQGLWDAPDWVKTWHDWINWLISLA